MKTNKYIEDSDEEEDKEFKPSKRPQSDDEEEFEEEGEDAKEVKKVKRSSGEKPAKAEKDVTRDAQGNQYIELSNKRRITIRTFSSGEPSVDIREVYKDKVSGEMRPGKSGITFPIVQWTKLKELIPEVDEAIKALEKK